MVMSTSTSTVATVAKMAQFFMALALLLPAAVADLATISPMAVLPAYFQASAMMLSLSPTEPGPVPYEYPIVPLTRRSGLNATNSNIFKV
jgi:hypothetical protein